MSKQIAIIDLGTNSVRFDIYAFRNGRTFKRIYRDKQMVRLGENLYRNGKLDRLAVSRTLEALDGFCKKSKSMEVKNTIAFATSALRDSADKEKVISLVRDRCGIDLRVLSGEEEAQLIAKGILAHEAPPVENYALVDIGGGSTEVSICEGKKILDSFSFNLGVTRLQQMFLKTSPPTPTTEGPGAVSLLRRYIEEMVIPVRKVRKWPAVGTFLGSSGTILAIRKVLKKADRKVDPFSKKALADLVLKISPMTSMELMMVPGMEWKRVDMILAGTLLLEKMMCLLGSEKVYTTLYALRDGILEVELETMR